MLGERFTWRLQQRLGTWNGSHNPPESRHSRHLSKRRIAAEQFVASNARQHDFVAAFGDSLAGKPGVHTVDRRLVHRVENAWNIVLEFGPGDNAHVVRQTIVIRGRPGHEGFVVATAGELLEADGNSLDSSPRLGCEPSDGSRVDAAGEEHADGHIGHEVSAH